MSNTTNASRPGYVEAILRLAADYGTTRVQQAKTSSAEEYVQLDHLAVEILGDIAVIATTRRVPDAGLDARLAAAGLAVARAALTPDSPDLPAESADYGFNRSQPTAPVAVSPERLTISDATIAEAERLERLHAHGGRDCYCETPDAVSPERVAEICAALFVVRANRAETHLAALPEFERVVESDADGWPVVVAFAGDVRIRRDLTTQAWSVTR